MFWNSDGASWKTAEEAAVVDAALDAKFKAEGDKKHPYKTKRLAVCKREGCVMGRGASRHNQKHVYTHCHSYVFCVVVHLIAVLYSRTAGRSAACLCKVMGWKQPAPPAFALR